MPVLVEIPDCILMVAMRKKVNRYNQSDGQCLTYCTRTKTYQITNISHCSCNSTNIRSIMRSEDTHTHI